MGVSFQRWFDDNGDYTHRLDYDLNDSSVVFDVGCYRGWFAEQISNRYGSLVYCFEPIPRLYRHLQRKFSAANNIVLHMVALSDRTGKMNMSNRRSRSSFNERGKIAVRCSTMDDVMLSLSVDHIDLLKINIEGAEYDLLDDMLEKNLMCLCDNIQVQFHDTVDDYKERYARIREGMEPTHYLTYEYPFVWENWKRK